MGLEGTGNQERRELSMSAWTLQSRGGKPLPGGRERAWVAHEPPGGCGQGQWPKPPRDGMGKVCGVLFLSQVFF